MAKNLVIVESPTKVKSISKYLGGDYIVKGSMGHVRDLPQKRIGVDIEHDFAPEYVVMPKSKTVVNALKKIVKDGIESIYLAPDPDREGEAIAWHLAELLSKKDGKVKIWRVAFNEITETAIREAFKKPGRIDLHKVDSQQARRILDRVVGYKLSPLLWQKVKRGLSAGRVQSVAVRLICERQEEIDNFKAEEYWSIDARLHPKDDVSKEFTASLEKIDGKKVKISNKEDADKITASLKDKDYVVASVEKKEKARNPVPPFSTSLLQQASINKLGFTAHKTMFVAQQLYEGIEIGKEGSIGLITYMRTDSFRVSKDAQDAVREYIDKKYGKEYVPAVPPRYKSKKSAQEAHEAIRPSHMDKSPDEIKEFLTPDQLKLYTLIWNRFVASQMTSARLSVTTILVSADNAIFKATGTEVVFPGFLAVYVDEEDEEKAKNLPSLLKGDPLVLIELLPEQHFTKPPAAYTEATLVKALEEKGIGRPSTYAPIIDTIVRRNYVSKEQRKLLPTDLGKHVNGILVDRFADILDVKFTAKMEEDLDEVERGKLSWVKVLKDFYTPFISDLEKAHVELKRMPLKPVETDKKCPKCGKTLVIRSGRFGQFIACSGFPECKHTEALSTNVKCPQLDCGGSLVHRRSGKGRSFFGCSNYPKCKFTTNSLKKYMPVEGEEASAENTELEEE
jgi:DNA topoisomerase-1